MLFILLGTGTGMNTSANSLALNTYFKRKRRLATGLSWTITGMGPIIMPQIIAVILPLYGVEGTVMIYSALALNAVVCALIYQPVKWHVKKIHTNKEKMLKRIKCDYCAVTNRKKQRIFSPKYLHNQDNSYKAGYEIIDPGVPMISFANDGWTLHKLRKRSKGVVLANIANQMIMEERKLNALNQNEENDESKANKAKAQFPPLTITPSSSNPLSIPIELTNADPKISTNGVS